MNGSVGIRLQQLLQEVEVLEVRGALDRLVAGIAYHADDVAPGYLFVAIPGTRKDGHDFVERALEHGACALVVERILPSVGETIPQIRVPDSRRALARIAAAFYGNPARDLILIGITGTNGKTTTSWILEAILRNAGFRPGVMGTIHYRFEGLQWSTSTTTPESLDLQRMLREMARAGATHAIMEVTSHALDQSRVEGCIFRVGVFTNLSRDHLDYHGNMEGYLRAKARLFQEHLPSEEAGGWAVFNAGDPASVELASLCRARKVFFGRESRCHFRALRWEADLKGTRLRLAFPGGEMEMTSSLIGDFNVDNILAACASAWALRIDPEVWKKAVATLPPIRGRFEPIRGMKGPTVVVDYAHTPEALERVLASARNLVRGKLICVFGCGGDRDRGKRPLMARAAAAFSDLVVVTSDNPRTESPGAIIREILQGFNGKKIHPLHPDHDPQEGPFPAYTVLEDRREAIRWAIRRARSHDMVLIAGKGHETFQLIGGRRIPFDDAEEARKALKEMGE